MSQAKFLVCFKCPGGTDFLSYLFASAYAVPSACPAGHSLLFQLSSDAPFCGCSPPTLEPSPMLPGASCRALCCLAVYVVCVSLPTGLGERWGTDHSFLFLGPQRSSACRGPQEDLGSVARRHPPFTGDPWLGRRGAREGVMHFGSDVPNCPPTLWTLPQGRPLWGGSPL